MTNERALVEGLQRLGVRHVQMTGMSLDEQIAAVMDAKVIIAPHGAGLTNVLYARLGAFVYELFPSDYRPDCYQQVAVACGLDYDCDVFDTLKAGRHDLAWEVDIDKVLAKTESLLRRAC
jgi:capsular polysaccharide biosynthesis protein